MQQHKKQQAMTLFFEIFNFAGLGVVLVTKKEGKQLQINANGDSFELARMLAEGCFDVNEKDDVYGTLLHVTC